MAIKLQKSLAFNRCKPVVIEQNNPIIRVFAGSKGRRLAQPGQVITVTNGQKINTLS